jgi:hypothetical protein
MSTVHTAAQILGCGRPYRGSTTPMPRYVLSPAPDSPGMVSVVDIATDYEYEAIALHPADFSALVPCWWCGSARPADGRVYVGVGRWQCAYQAQDGLREGCRPRLLELGATHPTKKSLTADGALSAAVALFADFNSHGFPGEDRQARIEVCKAVRRYPRIGRMVMVAEEELAAVRRVVQDAVDYWEARPPTTDYRVVTELALSALLTGSAHAKHTELPVFRETGDGVWVWKSTAGQVQVARQGGSTWRVRWPGEPGKPNQAPVAFMGTAEATIRASRALLAQIGIDPAGVTTR